MSVINTLRRSRSVDNTCGVTTVALWSDAEVEQEAVSIYEHIFQHLKPQYLSQGTTGEDLNAATESAAVRSSK